eukprot:tig00000227_g19837.t1
MFLSEANIDPNSVQPQNIPIQSQQGLLSEWWEIFWDLYAAQLRDGNKIAFPEAGVPGSRQGAIEASALSRQGSGFQGGHNEAGPSTVSAIQPPGRGTAQVKAVTGPAGTGAMGKPRAKSVSGAAMAANGAGRKGESEPNSPQVPNSPMHQDALGNQGSPMDGLNVNSPTVMGPGGARFPGAGAQGGPMGGGRGMVMPGSSQAAALMQQQQRMAAMQQQQMAAAAAAGGWPFPQGQLAMMPGGVPGPMPPNSSGPGVEGGTLGSAARYPGFPGDALMQQMAQQMKAAAAQQKAKGNAVQMNTPPEFAGRGGPQGSPVAQMMYGKWPAGLTPELIAQQQKFRHQMMQLPPGHPQQQQFLMQQKALQQAAAAAAAGNPALMSRLMAASQAAMMRKDGSSVPGTPGQDGMGPPMSPADPSSPQVAGPGAMHAALAAAAASGQPISAEQLKQMGITNQQQMMMLLRGGRMGPPGPMGGGPGDGSQHGGPGGPGSQQDDGGGGGDGKPPSGAGGGRASAGRKRKSPGTQGESQSPSIPAVGSPAPGSENHSQPSTPMLSGGQPGGMPTLPIAGPGAAAALQQHHSMMMSMHAKLGQQAAAAAMASAGGPGGPGHGMNAGTPGPPPGPPPEVPTADDTSFFMDDAVNDFLAGGDLGGLAHDDPISALGVPSADSALRL